jgi:hypothetical protein
LIFGSDILHLFFRRGIFMPLKVIVGAQRGDEGKRCIVDWFSSKAEDNTPIMAAIMPVTPPQEEEAFMKTISSRPVSSTLTWWRS